MTEKLPESEGPAQSGVSQFNRRMWIANAGLCLVAGAVALKTKCNRDNARQQMRELLVHGEFPRSQPEKLSGDPEFDKELREKFEVIAGSASYEDAKVIGIGELHFLNAVQDKSRKEHARKAFVAANIIAQTLDSQVKEGDHFLLEGLDWRNKNMPPRRSMPLTYPWAIGLHDRKDITFGGWDDVAIKNDASLSMPVSSKLRNEQGMIPAIAESVHANKGKTYVVAGVRHFTDDPRIDQSLEKEGIPYLILGEKFALEITREVAKKFEISE